MSAPRARALLAAGLAAALLAPAAAHADHRRLVQVSAGGNDEVAASWGGATPDGTKAYFGTPEPLVAADTDGVSDVYVRTRNTTDLVSLPEPVDADGDRAAGFSGVNPLGSAVAMLSSDPLTADDDDGSADLFERIGGHTYLVTAPDDSDVLLHTSPTYAGMSDDGAHVLFLSGERLARGDRDDSVDLYERYDGHTVRLSQGTINGSGRFGVGPGGGVRLISVDGSRAFFETREALLDEDTDASTDVYMRSGGTTTLVTATSTAIAGDMTLRQTTPDGAHVYFQTNEAIDPADVDDRIDAYHADVATDGTVSIHLDSPGAGAPDATDVDFQRGTDDGTHVFFTTYERLTPADTDAFSDLYQTTGGVTTLESTGPNGGNSGPDDQVFSGINPAGTRVYVRTKERLTPDDTDFADDVYERFEGVTRRVTVSERQDNGPYAASLAGASPDGTRILFQSAGPLTADDVDHEDDLFERVDGATRLLTGGTLDLPEIYRGVSDDARHVFFTSAERLLPSDTDSSVDVYESRVNTPPAIAEDLAASDADGDALTSATVAVTGGFVAGEDRLVAAGVDGLTATAEPDGHAITFTGAAGDDAFTAALRGVALEPGPTPGTRTIAFTTSDDLDTSAAVERTVTVDPPAPSAGDGGATTTTTTPATTETTPADAPAAGPPPRDVVAPGTSVAGISDGALFTPRTAPRTITVDVADDPSGLLMLKLRITRRLGDRCWSWSRTHGAFRRIRCGSRGWFYRAATAAPFTFDAHAKLPPGRYVLDVQAIDRAYNRTPGARGRSRIVFTVRR